MMGDGLKAQLCCTKPNQRQGSHRKLSITSTIILKTLNTDIMEYVTVEARFLFFDGVCRYTVEYTFGLSKWFIFQGSEQQNAIYHKEDKKIKFKDINCLSAKVILDDFLNTP